jgi:Tol biopolymer transport system component
MHAVLNVEPEDLPTLMPNVPPSLDAIVRHCLEKNPRDRFQSARDLAFQLRTLPDLQKSTTSIPSQDNAQALRRLRSRPMLAIAALLLLAGATAGGLALFRRGGAGEQGPPRTFRQLTFNDGPEIFPTFAPDGKSFAYVSSESGNRDIYVQRVEGRIPSNVTGDSPDADAEPAFSPDGSQLAFRSERGGGGIFVMGVTGENVRRLTNFGHNPSWSPDGTHLVVSTAATDLRPHVHPINGDLWIIDARTGGKRPLFMAGRGSEHDAVQPVWSPHGRRIAFWGVSERGAERDIWTIDPDAPQPKDTVVRVTADVSLHWNPVWSPDGRYLYFGSNRDGTMNLWRIAVDEESGKPDGVAEPVSLPAAISGNFGFSQQGDLIFTTVMRFYRLLSMPFDANSGATGEPRPLFGGSQEILSFEPSPDGRAIAFTTAGTQEDLFVANADGTRLRQLTNDAARDRGVTWSPDGTTLYFYSNREGGYQLWSISVDGSNVTRLTDAADLRRIGARNVFSPNASPDGRMLAAEAEGGIAVLVHLDRPISQRVEVIATNIIGPKFSLDGKQLVGSVPGRGGIVVCPLATRKVTRVLDRGLFPQWLAGGNRIAFFEKGSIGILDLDRQQPIAASFKATPGVELDDAVAGPRISRDRTALYVRQTIEQGDIWMVRFEKE